MIAELHNGQYETAAVVSGADQPFGVACAEALAGEGAVVIGAGGDVAHDVADDASWRRVIDAALSDHGQLDILVNAAQAFLDKPFVDTTLEELRHIEETNLLGAWLGVKHGILAMRKSGGGSIVTVTSNSAKAGQPGAAAVCAARQHIPPQRRVAQSAMYAGRYQDAVLGCKQSVAAIPDELRDKPSAGEYLTSISHVYIRFGRWEELLSAPPPPSNHPYALALHHYGRGVACANTGRLDQARSEAAKFEKHAAAVPDDTAYRRVLAHDVLEIARNMLAGETEFKAGDEQKGLEHLRRATELEDRLRYQEPSSWMMPARHALGALLLDAGEVDEAEAVYRKDLELHRENGWALHGLAQCMERKGLAAEAAAVRLRFDDAWADATVRIKSSCFCARGADKVFAK